MEKALFQPVLEVLDGAALSVSRLGFAEVAVLDFVLRANLGRYQQFSQSTSHECVITRCACGNKSMRLAYPAAMPVLVLVETGETGQASGGGDPASEPAAEAAKAAGCPTET